MYHKPANEVTASEGPTECTNKPTIKVTKRRVPQWTDEVIWTILNITCILYRKAR